MRDMNQERHETKRQKETRDETKRQRDEERHET